MQHAEINADFHLEIQRNLLLIIGQINSKHEVIKVALNEIVIGLNLDNANDVVATTRREILHLFETLPRVDYFESLALTCDDKSFFETLLMTVKNTALSTQHSFYKRKAISKDTQKKINKVKT